MADSRPVVHFDDLPLKKYQMHLHNFGRKNWVEYEEFEPKSYGLKHEQTWYAQVSVSRAYFRDEVEPRYNLGVFTGCGSTKQQARDAACGSVLLTLGVNLRALSD